MKQEIYTVYAEAQDMTFICMDEFDEDGNSVSTKVTGFYFGEPNEADTKLYDGSLEARFD